MQHEKMKQMLKSLLDERAFDDTASLVSYGYDGSFGQYIPDVVTQPCSTKEVQAIVKLANQYQCPIYPRGAAPIYQEELYLFKEALYLIFHSGMTHPSYTQKI